MTMTFAPYRAVCVAFALLASAPAWAQHVAPPGVDPSAFKPYSERNDVVSWRTFAQVDLVRMKDRYVPQFSDNVAALDKKEVRVQGFMIPLDASPQQRHFLISAMPQTCMFCMPGGPESMVEVKTKQPVKYGFEPFVVSGRLAVLYNDPTGIFYRIVDAELIK
jgi:hypothetical protein